MSVRSGAERREWDHLGFPAVDRLGFQGRRFFQRLQSLYEIVNVQNQKCREKNGEDQPECLLELGQLRLQSVPSVAKIVIFLGHSGDLPIEIVLELVAPHQLGARSDRRRQVNHLSDLEILPVDAVV